MAARILNGEAAGEIPVMTMKDYSVYLNDETAAAIEMEVPQSVMDRAIILNSTTQE